VEARVRGGPIDPARTGGAGKRRDRSVEIDRADPIVVGVGHDHAAGAVDGDTDGRVETGGARRTVAIPGDPVASVRRHVTIGRDAPDGVVSSVGNEERAGRVHGYPRRRPEPG
jgi:hypothetical protein